MEELHQIKQEMHIILGYKELMHMYLTTLFSCEIDRRFIFIYRAPQKVRFLISRNSSSYINDVASVGKKVSNSS